MTDKTYLLERHGQVFGEGLADKSLHTAGQFVVAIHISIAVYIFEGAAPAALFSNAVLLLFALFLVTDFGPDVVQWESIDRSKNEEAEQAT